MIEKSRVLSLLLRHKPEKAGLKLDKEGWVLINSLLYNLKTFMDIDMTHSELIDIVNNNDKKRFTISENGHSIRAAQGHSVNVDIKMMKGNPKILFHGTKKEFLPSIKKNGLLKGTRNHVHLSSIPKTAQIVADRRKGKSIILEVKGDEMVKDGYKFFISENGVWLTDHVPAKYLKYGE